MSCLTNVKQPSIWFPLVFTAHRTWLCALGFSHLISFSLISNVLFEQTCPHTSALLCTPLLRCFLTLYYFPSAVPPENHGVFLHVKKRPLVASCLQSLPFLNLTTSCGPLTLFPSMCDRIRTVAFNSTPPLSLCTSGRSIICHISVFPSMVFEQHVIRPKLKAGSKFVYVTSISWHCAVYLVPPHDPLALFARRCTFSGTYHNSSDFMHFVNSNELAWCHIIQADNKNKHLWID